MMVVHREPGIDAEQVAVLALLAARLPAAELENVKAATPEELRGRADCKRSIELNVSISTAHTRCFRRRKRGDSQPSSNASPVRSIPCAEWKLSKAAASASTARAISARAPVRKTSLNESAKVPGCECWKTYHSLGGEAEALNTPPRYAAHPFMPPPTFVHSSHEGHAFFSSLEGPQFLQI
jgi:hypothetical protein